MKRSISFPFRPAIIFILIISVPYLLAFFMSGTNYQFGGFLLNPIDGNSYLAKMFEGWRGEWRFTLPYAAKPGEGAYVYTYYLFLGHLARWLKSNLVVVYHTARLMAALFLLWTTWQFFRVTVSAKKWLGLAFTLAFLGLGLGWVLIPAGVIIADSWVAEAYPFLSSYTNPHFPLSIALALFLLAFEFKSEYKLWMPFLVVIAAAMLASLSPFSWGIALGILTGLIIWELLTREELEGSREIAPEQPSSFFFKLPEHIKSIGLKIFLIAGGGIPVVLYTYRSINKDPILALWNSQNLTLTPPVWDLILAFSPVLILAIPGAWHVIKNKERAGRMLVLWVAITIALIYLPLDLQRRFMTGLYIPLCGLAAYGMVEFEGIWPKRVRLFSIAVVLFSIPTTILILLIGQFGVWNHEPELYLDNRESSALNWLEKNTRADALILGSPRLGLFIPAQIGRRVIYGHPFETPNAQVEKANVERFFTDVTQNPLKARRFLDDRRVDFVLYVPEISGGAGLEEVPGLEIVYKQDDVIIYQVNPL